MADHLSATSRYKQREPTLNHTHNTVHFQARHTLFRVCYEALKRRVGRHSIPEPTRSGIGMRHLWIALTVVTAGLGAHTTCFGIRTNDANWKMSSAFRFRLDWVLISWAGQNFVVSKKKTFWFVFFKFDGFFWPSSHAAMCHGRPDVENCGIVHPNGWNEIFDIA